MIVSVKISTGKRDLKGFSPIYLILTNNIDDPRLVIKVFDSRNLNTYWNLLWLLINQI